MELMTYTWITAARILCITFPTDTTHRRRDNNFRSERLCALFIRNDSLINPIQFWWQQGRSTSVDCIFLGKRRKKMKMPENLRNSKPTIRCSSVSAHTCLTTVKSPTYRLRQWRQSNRLHELRENNWHRQSDQCNVIVQCVLVVAAMLDELLRSQRYERTIEIAWAESQIECGVAVCAMRCS